MIASFYGEDEQTRTKVFEDNLSKCVSSLTGNYFPKEVSYIIVVVIVSIDFVIVDGGSVVIAVAIYFVVIDDVVKNRGHCSSCI